MTKDPSHPEKWTNEEISESPAEYIAAQAVAREHEAEKEANVVAEFRPRLPRRTLTSWRAATPWAARIGRCN